MEDNRSMGELIEASDRVVSGKGQSEDAELTERLDMQTKRAVGVVGKDVDRVQALLSKVDKFFRDESDKLKGIPGANAAHGNLYKAIDKLMDVNRALDKFVF